MSTPTMLKTSEVAKRLRITTTRVAQLCAEGKLEYTRNGTNGHFLVSEDSLEKFINRSKAKQSRVLIRRNMVRSSEASIMLGCSVNKIIEMCKNGSFPGAVIHKNAWLIPSQSIKECKFNSISSSVKPYFWKSRNSWYVNLEINGKKTKRRVGKTESEAIDNCKRLSSAITHENLTCETDEIDYLRGVIVRLNSKIAELYVPNGLQSIIPSNDSLTAPYSIDDSTKKAICRSLMIAYPDKWSVLSSMPLDEYRWPGVYFASNGESMLYVGASSDVSKRLGRHDVIKKENLVSAIRSVSSRDAFLMEHFYIWLFRPILNSTPGE